MIWILYYGAQVALAVGIVRMKRAKRSESQEIVQ
jgi:hypothetical protein